MLNKTPNNNDSKISAPRPSVKDDAQAIKQQMQMAAAQEEQNLDPANTISDQATNESSAHENGQLTDANAQSAGVVQPTDDVQSAGISQAGEPVDENTETKKTVVEFFEDKIEDAKPDNAPKSKHMFFKILFGGLVFALICGLVFGIWNRWFRYDDHALLVSNWQISGTNQIVPITDKTITLAPDAVLEYTLDTGSKVINYKIGDMTGRSHYRFSWDTNQVAIIENGSFNPISTMLSDLGWFWDWSTCGMSNIDLSPAYTKNNIDSVDTENTGLDDIMVNGRDRSILLDKIPTKDSKDTHAA